MSTAVETEILKPYYSRNGLEMSDVAEALDLNFFLGNVLKYIWRNGEKHGGSPQDRLNDCSKAAFYLGKEMERLVALMAPPPISDREPDPGAFLSDKRAMDMAQAFEELLKRSVSDARATIASHFDNAPGFCMDAAGRCDDCDVVANSSECDGCEFELDYERAYEEDY